jgi:hypothetical protein
MIGHAASWLLPRRHDLLPALAAAVTSKMKESFMHIFRIFLL